MGSLEAEIEQQLATLFRRTFAIHVRTSGGRVELDRSSYGILCLLVDGGPQRLGHIALAFGLDPSTITRQVQALVAAGLAQKSPDPSDRRATLLTLTDSGRETIIDTREGRVRMLGQIMGDWTAHEREEFLRAVSRFNSTIGEWMDTPPAPRTSVPDLDACAGQRST